MNFIEKIRLLERVDQLVRMKAAGNARQLTARIKVSKSTVYEILDLMKLMGADIEYCNKRGSYIYTSKKMLAIGFVDTNLIKGGKSFEDFYCCPVFSDNFI